MFMQQAQETLGTALRVLTAIVDRRNPHPADLDCLRRFAPSLADASPDELAREVIQAMKLAILNSARIGQFAVYDPSIVGIVTVAA
jgi:hypothetical protein